MPERLMGGRPYGIMMPYTYLISAASCKVVDTGTKVMGQR